MFISLLFAKICFHYAKIVGQVRRLTTLVSWLRNWFHCFDAYGYLTNITTFHPTTFNVGTSQSLPIEKITGDTPTWLNILFQSVSLFEVKDLLSYCIDELKILGDVLLYKISLEN
jgi:hypothetical protein